MYLLFSSFFVLLRSPESRRLSRLLNYFRRKDDEGQSGYDLIGVTGK
jgi:hypothetical protein